MSIYQSINPKINISIMLEDTPLKNWSVKSINQSFNQSSNQSKVPTVHPLSYKLPNFHFIDFYTFSLFINNCITENECKLMKWTIMKIYEIKVESLQPRNQTTNKAGKGYYICFENIRILWAHPLTLTWRIWRPLLHYFLLFLYGPPLKI